MEKSKINIANIISPANDILKKLENKESITEEDRKYLSDIFPVKMAYEELMRRVRIFQEQHEG